MNATNPRPHRPDQTNLVLTLWIAFIILFLASLVAGCDMAPLEPSEPYDTYVVRADTFYSPCFDVMYVSKYRCMHIVKTRVKVWQ